MLRKTSDRTGTYWTLNGIYIGDYKKLPKPTIDRLEFITEQDGVKHFRAKGMPSGTLELWYNKTRLAAIYGDDA